MGETPLPAGYSGQGFDADHAEATPRCQPALCGRFSSVCCVVVVCGMDGPAEEGGAAAVAGGDRLTEEDAGDGSPGTFIRDLLIECSGGPELLDLADQVWTSHCPRYRVCCGLREPHLRAVYPCSLSAERVVSKIASTSYLACVCVICVWMLRARVGCRIGAPREACRRECLRECAAVLLRESSAMGTCTHSEAATSEHQNHDESSGQLCLVSRRIQRTLCGPAPLHAVPTTHPFSVLV